MNSNTTCSSVESCRCEHIFTLLTWQLRREHWLTISNSVYVSCHLNKQHYMSCPSVRSARVPHSKTENVEKPKITFLMIYSITLYSAIRLPLHIMQSCNYAIMLAAANFYIKRATNTGVDKGGRVLRTRVVVASVPRETNPLVAHFKLIFFQNSVKMHPNAPFWHESRQCLGEGYTSPHARRVFQPTTWVPLLPTPVSTNTTRLQTCDGLTSCYSWWSLGRQARSRLRYVNTHLPIRRRLGLDQFTIHLQAYAQASLLQKAKLRLLYFTR